VSPGAPLLVALVLLGACGRDGVAAGPPPPDRPAREELAALHREPEPERPTPPVTAGPGEVVVQAGPFTDRLHLSSLRFHPGPQPAVTGTVASSTEVSDVLFLRIRADFMDVADRTVGSVEQVVDAGDEVEAGHPIEIHLAGTAAPEAVGAVVSVPQFVTE
jgi:hypothetical protein